MYEISEYFEQLKVSAFRKAEKIKNDVHDVTLGPNRQEVYPEERAVETPKPKNISKIETQETRFNIIPIKQLRKELENDDRVKIQNAVDQHVKAFEEFTIHQNELKRQQWILKQKQIIKSAEEREHTIAMALKQYEESASKREEKELHKNLEEKRRQYELMLEAKAKEKEMYAAFLDNKKEFHNISTEFIAFLRETQNAKYTGLVKDIWLHFRELGKIFEGLVPSEKYAAGENEIKKSIEIVKMATTLKQKAVTVIQKQIEADKKVEVKPEPTKKVEKKDPKTTSINQSVNLDKHISKASFKIYSELVDFQEKYLESFKELASNNNYKQFRFDCKKAVNIPVNAISRVSSQHLLDKYVKLSNLLRGESVAIGDSKIIATQHPQGLKFCTDLLAKKFVLQGDLMISSNPESAYCYATIILSLQNEFPDFGKLLQSYFYKECPYLIPFYIPKYTEQSDEEFYKNSGYRYVDGVIEKQDKFLKRMTGIARLYFALLVTWPKKSQSQHPLGLKVAWNWFVSILKLEPHLDITATLVHTFLEIVGHEMQSKYNKAFLKLFAIFCGPFMESMKKVDSGGPVSRLEVMLQEFKENGNRFKKPEGLLDRNFW